jgi:prevent-host-death family protein
MHTVGSYEAKTHLAQLLGRVEHGEIITITRHGKPVVRLVPAVASTPRPDVVAAIAAMQTF